MDPVHPEQDKLIATIESTIRALREIAQPYEIARLRELASDVRLVETQDQLEAIDDEVASLRRFCEQRLKSSSRNPAVYLTPPPSGPRRA